MGILYFKAGPRIVNRTLTDKILEGLTIILIVSLWGLTVYFWKILPDEIPLHFDFSGQPNAWGSKNQLFWITGIATLIALAFGIAAYYPKMMRVPVQLRQECLVAQYIMIGRMARVCNVLVMSIFIFSVIYTIQSALGRPVNLWYGAIAGTILLLFVYILVCSLKISRYGRQ